MAEWQCATCGKVHGELPRSFSWSRPYDYFAASEEDRASLVCVSDDLCHIGDQLHFLRCTLSLPVRDHGTTLIFGLWVGVDKTNFYRYVHYLRYEDSEPDPPPLHGALSAALPGVDPDGVLWSEVLVHVQRDNRVPEVQIVDSANPLFDLQQSGVTADYWHSVVRELHPDVAAQLGI
jgi:hypothetical protein